MPLFNDPRKDLTDVMKKPFLMSKRKWRKMQDKYAQAQNIVHKDELAANEQRMGLFQDLFDNLSGFEGLENFGELKADYGLGVGNIFAAASPLLNSVIDEHAPQDTNLNHTVNPSIIPNYKHGGEVGLELAQTEKGEVYVQPDLTISDTKSESTHKKMDSDDVTDIFGEGYVFSDNVKIKRKDADIVFGYSQPLYEEDENGLKVKEHNFLDVFKDDKEVGSAELANRIKDKYKIVDEDKVFGNPLVEKANEENRRSREMWVSTLVALTEDKKIGSPKIQVQKYGKGGKTAKSPKGTKPKKYADPDETGLEKILGLVPGFGTLFNAGLDIFKMFKQNKQNKRNLAELDELSERQQSNLGIGALATLGSTFAQDPTETAPDLTSTINTFKQQQRRTPQYLKDYGASQIDRTTNQMAAQLSQTAPDFQTLSANLNSLQANALEKKSDFVANANAQDINLNNAYLRGLSGLYSQDATNQAQKKNQERVNRNQQTVRTGDTVNNYLNQVNALDSSKFATKLGIQGQNAAAQNALSNSLFQNTMVASKLLGNSISSNRLPPASVPTTDASTPTNATGMYHFAPGAPQIPSQYNSGYTVNPITGELERDLTQFIY